MDIPASSFNSSLKFDSVNEDAIFSQCVLDTLTLSNDSLLFCRAPFVGSFAVGFVDENTVAATKLGFNGVMSDGDWLKDSED